MISIGIFRMKAYENCLIRHMAVSEIDPDYLLQSAD